MTSFLKVDDWTYISLSTVHSIVTSCHDDAATTALSAVSSPPTPFGIPR